LASSLFEAKQRQTQRNDAGAQMGTHPVLADYQAALQRGDQRAIEAQQLLSANNPQQLRQVALNMLQQRGLSPEGFIKRLGLR